MTRDPVERVWSAYNFAVANGWESLSLADALAAEDRRRHGSHTERVELAYVYNSRHDAHIARIQRYYPESQVHVLTLSQLADASGRTLAPLLQQLELPSVALPALPPQNTAMTPKSVRLQRWVVGESRVKRALRATIPARWKVGFHKHISTSLLSWNRTVSTPRPMSPADRALNHAALEQP